jgi:hypothetical protein
MANFANRRHFSATRGVLANHAIRRPDTAKLKGARYLPQPQSFPQLHSFLSFIGQFLPVFLQFGLSAAKETVQASAIKTESRILLYFAIR